MVESALLGGEWKSSDSPEESPVLIPAGGKGAGGLTKSHRICSIRYDLGSQLESLGDTGQRWKERQRSVGQ